MEKKLTNKSKENIIYLSEDDARALGIVEGDTESIFVDGKKVSLSFVDEHEIFDISADERRILSNALSLRKKELSSKIGAMDPETRSSYLVPYGSVNDEHPDFDTLQVSRKGRGVFGSVKAFLFGRRGQPAAAQARDYLGNNRYKNRTDIFTNEEIQIIQEVISRAQGSSYAGYSSRSSSTSLAKKTTSKTTKTGVTSPKKKQARKAARRNTSKSKKTKK